MCFQYRTDYSVKEGDQSQNIGKDAMNIYRNATSAYRGKPAYVTILDNIIVRRNNDTKSRFSAQRYLFCAENLFFLPFLFLFFKKSSNFAEKLRKTFLSMPSSVNIIKITYTS